MELGELSEGLKLASIDVGSVFYMTFYTEDGIVPKESNETSRNKYFVVLGKSADGLLVASVLINSEINANKAKDIEDYQLKILATDYDFLVHDSYVDGYQVKEISTERILKDANYIGRLKQDDIDLVIVRVNESPVIKPYILEMYHLGL